MRTILVCGSRDWTDRLSIVAALSQYYHSTEPVCIMHGAASRKDPVTGVELSADMIADEVARHFGFTVRAVPADWKLHGRRAGILRNLWMLDQEPERVTAFQRNGSPGTQHTVDEARRRGIPVELHTMVDGPTVCLLRRA